MYWANQARYTRHACHFMSAGHAWYDDEIHVGAPQRASTTRKIAMSTVFLVLFAVSLAAVVVSLFGGLFIMTRPGDANRRRSNYLMRARIASQIGAVGVLILFMVTK